MYPPVRAPLLFVTLLATLAVPACTREDAAPLSPRIAVEAARSGNQLLMDDPSGQIPRSPRTGPSI